LQIGIAADGVDHMAGGEVIDVVGERRQRMGEDGDRNRAQHRGEQRRNREARQVPSGARR